MSFAFIPVDSERNRKASQDQFGNRKKAYPACFIESSLRSGGSFSTTPEGNEEIVCVDLHPEALF